MDRPGIEPRSPGPLANTLFILPKTLWVECSPMVLVSIPVHVIPIDTYLLNTYIIRYVSRVKWSNPGKGVASSPKPWCSSYWKGNFPVTLDHDRQLYFKYQKHFHSFSDSKEYLWLCEFFLEQNVFWRKKTSRCSKKWLSVKNMEDCDKSHIPSPWASALSFWHVASIVMK